MKIYLENDPPKKEKKRDEDLNMVQLLNLFILLSFITHKNFREKNY